MPRLSRNPGLPGRAWTKLLVERNRFAKPPLREQTLGLARLEGERFLMLARNGEGDKNGEAGWQEQVRNFGSGSI